MVGAPPQVFPTFGVDAITTPAGNASLKVRPVRAGEPAGFEIVNVRVLACPTPIVVGLKALASDGSGVTERQLAVTPLVRRAVEPMLAAPLVCEAGVAAQLPLSVLEVTSTVITHEAWAPFIVAPPPAFPPLPPMAKVLPPAAAVMVGTPPQLLTTLGTAAITRFSINASLKVSSARARQPARLVMVKVRVEVCPTPIGLVPKA